MCVYVPGTPYPQRYIIFPAYIQGECRAESQRSEISEDSTELKEVTKSSQMLYVSVVINRICAGAGWTASKKSCYSSQELILHGLLSTVSSATWVG